MEPLALAVPLTVAALAALFIFIVAVKYALSDPSARMRLTMTAFFIFIVFTLSASFWRWTLPSLKFALPALLLGAFAGHVVGIKNSLASMYVICGALLIINLIGFSDMFEHGAESWGIATSVVGAFLAGILLPCLLHLWTRRAKR